MRDIYLMSKETGELEPCEKVIREFYSTHKWDERWTDYWEETDMEVEGTERAFPDFTKCMNF